MASSRYNVSAPTRSHLIVMAAFFFLLGCLSLTFVHTGEWLWALAALGACMVLVSRLGGLASKAGIAVVCFALGLAHAGNAYDVPMPAPDTYVISGYVYGGAELRTDDRIAFALGDITLDGESVSGKAYCTLHYDSEAPALFDGARVTFEGRVYHPDEKSGEPHVSFRLWMRQHGYAYGIAAYQGITVENDESTAPVCDAAYRIRQRVDAALERTMGDNSRVAMALLLGQRDALKEDEYTAMQTLGIAHIMSVSGLHVGLVGGFVMHLLTLFKARRRTHIAVLSVFLIGYCSLTGFSAASVRAAAMLVCTCMALLLRRRGDRLTTLATAMLVVLLIDPLSALSAGFMLSFGAMLGIILGGPPIARALDVLFPTPPVDHKDRKKLSSVQLSKQPKALLTVSVAAQLGVLLPTVRFFQQLPLYGIFINLLIVPLVSCVLVPVYLITLPLSLLPPFGLLLGKAASLLTSFLLWLVQLLAKLPYATIRVAAPPALVCFGLAAAAVILSRRIPARFRTRLIASVLTATVAFGSWMLAKPADLRYIQLSVGQADSALLLDGRTTVVIDTGADGEELIDYLRYENRSVDALILTHIHLDHAGGVQALLESGIPVKHIYLPVNAALQQTDEETRAICDLLMTGDIPVTPLASGDELRYNRSAIRVLWPQRETVRTGHNANDYALAMAIDLDGYTLLHASDLTGLYERYAAVPADVLKVAHHGSSESTYEDFLRFVAPRYALLSVTYSSRTLPDEQTLARLAAQDVTLFRTDECGDITLAMQDGALTITPYKERTHP